MNVGVCMWAQEGEKEVQVAAFWLRQDSSKGLCRWKQVCVCVCGLGGSCHSVCVCVSFKEYMSEVIYMEKASSSEP